MIDRKLSKQNALIQIIGRWAILLVSLVLFAGCSDDSLGPKHNRDKSGLVFNDDCGFVITPEMLDRRFNEITFPGTHNSTTWGFVPHCRNQDLDILQQLENGIRYIEFDVNDALMICHGLFCHSDRTMKSCLNDIKDYAKGHPNQVITVRISDLCVGLGVSESYHRINGQLEPDNSDLGAYIYNWNPDMPKDDPGRCYIPDPWPTLREMIESGKNVMFIHHRDYKEHGVLDEAYVLTLEYSFPGSVASYNAKEQEQFCRLMPSWSPTRDRQKDGPNRLFYIECCPDAGAVAGDQNDAAKNNDGRRLYQVAKQHETEILPDNRVVNFINVDYFMSSHAKHLPIDVVDACNRLNFERFGSDWEHSACFWELYPHEFDNSRVEHLSQILAIQAEVDSVVAGFEDELDLDGHEDKGKIRSTTYETDYDWKRLPEWAVDNDLWTRWCGSSSRPNHTWGIDLGGSRPIDEIAIAWEKPHRNPEFKIYASNNDRKFADGISDEELLDDGGWTEIGSGDEQTNENPDSLWDIHTFSEIPVVDPDYTNLLAGRNIDAGDISFEIVDGELLVTYTSTGGWKMKTLHLWVGCDPDGYPHGRSGNPKIGEFPFVFDVAGGTSHTFIIDLTDPAIVSCLGTIDCENGNLFYAMAHAEMFKGDGFGGYRYKNGWADGNAVGGRNWAMAVLTVECVSDWRYFKIKVTKASDDCWPSFWEVKLYGPAY